MIVFTTKDLMALLTDNDDPTCPQSLAAVVPAASALPAEDLFAFALVAQSWSTDAVRVLCSLLPSVGTCSSAWKSCHQIRTATQCMQSAAVIFDVICSDLCRPSPALFLRLDAQTHRCISSLQKCFRHGLELYTATSSIEKFFVLRY